MATFIPWPEINQFRHVVKDMKWKIDNEVGFNPKKTLVGTVKIHGTNAAIGVDLETFEWWAQSRNNVLTIQKDNAGFCAFVYPFMNEVLSDEETLNSLKLLVSYVQESFDEKIKTIMIYGEFFGGNIQSGVGVSQLQKSFCIFNATVYSEAGRPLMMYSPFSADVYVEGESPFVSVDIQSITKMSDVLRDFEQNQQKYVDQMGEEWVKEKEVTARRRLSMVDRWSLITSYDSFEIDVDFSDPVSIAEASNKMEEITKAVESCCPVAKSLGATPENGPMIGEGVVWIVKDNPFQKFKVKGDKHSSTKVTKLAAVDVEKVKSVQEFVDRVLTESRLNQGIEVMKRDGFEVSQKNTGVFIKWVSDDVVKEDADTMTQSGLCMKDVSKELSVKARLWYFEHLEE